MAISRRRQHGGARPGAGRPRKPVPPPPPKPDPFEQLLAEAREYAEAGVEEPTIVAVLTARHSLDEGRLKADGRLTKLRQTIILGHEVCRAQLIVETRRRALKTRKNDGSVNALALRARNLLGWDKQGVQDEPKPDLTGAHERLELELKKLADNRTALFGMPVTELDVLYWHRHKKWPWDPEAAGL